MISKQKVSTWCFSNNLNITFPYNHFPVKWDMNKILLWLVCVCSYQRNQYESVNLEHLRKIIMTWRHLFVIVQNTRTCNEQNKVNKHKITQVIYEALGPCLSSILTHSSLSQLFQCAFTLSHSLITNFHKHLLI